MKNEYVGAPKADVSSLIRIAASISQNYEETNLIVKICSAHSQARLNSLPRQTCVVLCCAHNCSQFFNIIHF